MKKTKKKEDYSPEKFNACYNLVLKFFNGNEDKVSLWFYTNNPMFGGMSPMSMIICGKLKKVNKFIENQLKENRD